LRLSRAEDIVYQTLKVDHIQYPVAVKTTAQVDRLSSAQSDVFDAMSITRTQKEQKVFHKITHSNFLFKFNSLFYKMI